MMRGKEELINPLGVLCHDQELGAFIFSKIVRKFTLP